MTGDGDRRHPDPRLRVTQFSLKLSRTPSQIRPRGRECICSHLAYQYVTVDSGEAARELERRCRRCEIFKSMLTLNAL